MSMIEPDQRVSVLDISRRENVLDSLYRSVWGDHLHHGLFLDGSESKEQAHLRMIEAVAKAARLQNGDHVCDVGCGYGTTAYLLAEEYGVHVTGFTVSRKQWETARYLAPHRGSLRFLLQDWLENDLPDQGFDVVIVLESSEQMPDKRAAFSEAWHALKPGGRIVVCSWLAAETTSSWEKDWLLRPICDEERIPSLGTMREYKSLLVSAGFKIQRAWDLSRLVTATWSRESLTDTLWHFLRNPSEVCGLSDAECARREFIMGQIRIRLAYETGALRYGLFTATKEKRERAQTQ